MATITLKHIHEPCLVHGNWIEIDLTFDSEQSAIKSFSDLYKKAEAKLKEKRFKKIEVIFPNDWQKLPKVLESLNFSPILFTLKLDLSVKLEPYAESDSIKSPKISYLDIIDLLAEQAEFHHKLYPDYYQKFKNVRSIFYENYIYMDLNKPESFYFTYNLKNKISGFILGEIETDHTHIWELIVSQECRGQGAGTLLIKKIIHESQIKKLKYLETETGWNQSSAGLYQKLGFVKTTISWYKNF